MSANGEWKSAKDPKSGNTYYYNTKTKETTWTMPLAMKSVTEQFEIMQKQRETKKFFDDMEKNIRNKMAGVDTKPMEQAEAKESAPTASKPIQISRGISSEFDRPRIKISLPFHASSPVDEEGSSSESAASMLVGRPRKNSVDDLQLNNSFTRGGHDHFVCGSGVRRGSGLLLHEFPMPMSPPVNSYIMMAAGGQGESPKKKPRGPRKRRNSTGTIYVQTTMSKQDNTATIQCVCTLICAHLLESSVNPIENDRQYDTFIDRKVKKEAKKCSSSDKQVPSLEAVSDFFDLVYSKSQLESECIIMALIYIERLLQKTKGSFSLKPNNWRSVLFACLVMASKVWDDLSMWNVDFSHVSAAFDLHRVNELELALLECFLYEVKVSAGEYAKFYFHIRSLIARLGYHKNSGYDLTPLDMEGAKKLQLATERFEEGRQNKVPAKGDGRPRCASYAVDYVRGPAPVVDGVSSSKKGPAVGAPPSSGLLHRRFLSDAPAIEQHHHGAQIGLEDLIHYEHNDADGIAHVSSKRISKAHRQSKMNNGHSEADSSNVHEAMGKLKLHK